MTTTTKTKTAPSLLTAEAQAEVSSALLRHATRNYAGAVLLEHTETVPPVAPESVTYRLGVLEVEELSWSHGGAKVSQRIDVWVPGAVAGSSTSAPVHLEHVTLGEVEQRVRQARLSDGTTVLSGVHTVEAFPFVPLIEGRSEQAARVALGGRHSGRKVAKVGPIEGTPEHRHQVVEVAVTTGGDVRGALRELRGMTTSAGYVAEVGEIDRWADQIGDGSFATATPSRGRVVVLAGVRLEWREA